MIFVLTDCNGWLSKLHSRCVTFTFWYFLKDSDVISFQPKDPVVALHPKYTYSYAPGVVLDIESDMWMNVRFYDGHEARLPREDIYRMSQEKFEYDVAYILKAEGQWVGQAVVSRNDESGVYQLGKRHLKLHHTFQRNSQSLF